MLAPENRPASTSSASSRGIGAKRDRKTVSSTLEMRGSTRLSGFARATASGNDGVICPSYKCQNCDRRRTPSSSGVISRKPLRVASAETGWRVGTKIGTPASKAAAQSGSASPRFTFGGSGNTTRLAPCSRTIRSSCAYSAPTAAGSLRSGSMLMITPSSSGSLLSCPANASNRNRSAATNHCAAGP